MMQSPDSPALRYEVAIEKAGRPSAQMTGAFAAELDSLARELDAHRPAADTLIGLDRPVTLHVAPLFDPFDAGLAQLQEMVRARPWERHLVLLTGQDARAAGLQARLTEVGAAVLVADGSLGNWDCWLWLMAKLDAICAQRLVIHLTPEDLAARLALRLMAQRYGRRLYVFQSAGRLVDPLPGVTHLVADVAARQTLHDLVRNDPLHVGVLSPVFRPERQFYRPDLPPPPPPPGPGRRAAVRWRAARAKWRLRWLETKALRLMARGPMAGTVLQGRELSRQMKLLAGRGAEFTVTAGDEADFPVDGPLAFSSVVTALLLATGGHHLHLGRVSIAFLRATLLSLDAAGIPRDRMQFRQWTGSFSEGFREVTPGLLLDIAGAAQGETQVAREAKWLGMAVIRPAPQDDADSLAERASLVLSGGLSSRLTALRSGRQTVRQTTDPARFARRLDAIIATAEGRLTGRPKADPDPALADLVATIFQPDHYLGQLPASVKAASASNPAAHYLAVGEALGFHPHPLFDPRLAERSMARTTGVAEAAADHPASVTGSVLGRYLVAGATAQPHQFFDPSHYLMQLPDPPTTPAVLADFLDRASQQSLSPHPLVEPAILMGAKQGGFLPVFLTWLKGGMGFTQTPHLLFYPGTFLAQDGGNRLRHAAPNLLWAYVVEGNLVGRHPSTLILPEEVEKTRPGTLIGAVTVLELLARNRLGTADPHPLVSTSHIIASADWLAKDLRHPLRYFIERGVADNIDPHPWFSTQFYLYSCPDVAQAGANPLLHYLQSGSREGRRPTGFFDGVSYYRRFLVHHIQMGEKHHPELLDYVMRGAGLFWSALDHDDGLRRLRLDTAIAQFMQDPQDPSEVAVKLLREAMHPPTGAEHPALVTETRALRRVTPAAGDEARDVTEFLPGETVTVVRPSVVASRHVAAASGEYEVPAIDAALYPGATVVAGNDGFITATGVWQDHGLWSFDPKVMEVKGNAAVVAVANDRVLIRRYRHSAALPAGIFCCGSYSKNYYHFLIETLPRAIFAARLAPPGTPVLTDDDMPAQHYQAIRLLLPHNPILRLARHRSYKVEKLWAGSMPNSFQDAFLKHEVPVDAVRVHPAILRLYGDLARQVWGQEADRSRLPRQVFLQRVSRWRQMFNAEEIIGALVHRGFEVRNPAHMGFADQIRAMANADSVVGQSGAQLANIVFARPGAKVFPLFSNAPGTNYNLWPVLAAPLGVQVVNVVGWRVPGSTGGAAPEAHEHFTLPSHLLTPFFLAPVFSKNAHVLLNSLQVAGAEAEALTSAWSITAEATPASFEHALLDLRRDALAAIVEAPEKDLPGLLNHPLFFDPWTTLKSGLRALPTQEATEVDAIARAMDLFAQLAEPETDPGADPPSDADLQRLMLVAMLLIPAWKAPLIARPEDLPEGLQDHYLRWIVQSPYLFRAGDDEGYVAYCARLLAWIDGQLAEDRPAKLRAAVARMAAGLDMGQLFLIEAPLGPVFAARNKVLQRIAVRHGSCRTAPRAADGSQGRRRIGVMFRTFEKGPDSEAVVAMFRAFPKDRYEIFGYSVGFKDRVVKTDEVFDREMDSAIEHRRLLSSNPTEIRAQILADNLDLFLFANATTYGIQAQELALYHRVAPVQVVANSHLPQPPGFPSFDTYLTGVSDHPDHELDQADYPEKLLGLKGPVICYMHSLKPRPRPPLNRASLGLTPDDVVMFNAGSMQKLRRECLMTMMRAVKDVPNGILMLAPYNPGWAGRAQAFAFNRQLAETAAEVGLDPARIKVLSELTVAEAEAALACSDIYLTPFPHGGATMIHLALIYGIPPVVLRRRSARSIDQFLVGSLGFSELLADSPAEYVRIAARLGHDRSACRDLAARIQKAAQSPVFVDNVDYSRDIEAAFAELLAAAALRPRARSV